MGNGVLYIAQMDFSEWPPGKLLAGTMKFSKPNYPPIIATWGNTTIFLTLTTPSNIHRENPSAVYLPI